MGDAKDKISNVCQAHSGMVEKLNSQEKDIDRISKDVKKLEEVNDKQWCEISTHSGYVKDWKDIKGQGKDIASMKTHLKIIMVLLVFILGLVTKIAIWGV